MKQCPTCKEVKSFSEFYKDKSQKDGHQAQCKSCSNATSTKAKLKRASNRAGTYVEVSITDYMCRMCKEVKPLSEFSKNVYSKHGFDYECKICKSQRARASYRTEGGRKRELVNRCKATSKRKELPFNLTVDDIVLVDTCPVLGIVIDYDLDKKSDNSPSIDRLIPEFGYVKGNVAIISERANRIKNDASVDEIRKLLEYLEEIFVAPTSG